MKKKKKKTRVNWKGRNYRAGIEGRAGAEESIQCLFPRLDSFLYIHEKKNGNSRYGSFEIFPRKDGRKNYIFILGK